MPALVLHAERCTFNGDYVMVLRVVEQTHRAQNAKGDKFESYELTIKSVSRPAFSKDTLFIRGRNEEDDNVAFVVSLADYERIKRAVRHYNEKHAVPVLESPPGVEVVA